MLRVLIGEAADAARPARRQVAVLETALDDENPQFVAALCRGCWTPGRSTRCWCRA